MSSICLTLRRLQPEDAQPMASIVRASIREFSKDGCGFALHDPELSDLYEAYTRPRSTYLIVTDGQEVCGGGGIAPLRGADEHVCELQKMYFRPDIRGQGMGRKLVHKLLDDAKAFGFESCYLETITELERANRLYLDMGFEQLSAPLGETGHFSCNRWYLKKLGV